MRERLGIRQEADLEVEKFFGKLRPEEMPEAIRAEHAKREAIWVDEVERLNVWPLLFVCGARHTEPFRELLESRGLRCTVVAIDWSPNETVQPPAPRATAERRDR